MNIKLKLKYTRTTIASVLLAVIVGSCLTAAALNAYYPQASVTYTLIAEPDPTPQPTPIQGTTELTYQANYLTVTLTATINPADTSKTAVFYEGATELGRQSINSNGQASI